jgi:hypothetical protein
VIELDSDVQKEVIDLTPRSDVKSEPEREPEPGTKSKARQTFEKRRSMLELRQGRTPKPTCSELKPSKDFDPFDNDLAGKIEGMKEEGFSAEYIADDLRLPLDTVKTLLVMTEAEILRTHLSKAGKAGNTAMRKKYAHKLKKVCF